MQKSIYFTEETIFISQIIKNFETIKTITRTINFMENMHLSFKWFLNLQLDL